MNPKRVERVIRTSAASVLFAAFVASAVLWKGAASTHAAQAGYNAGRLLFRSRNIGGSPLGQIWTMNADGSNARRVTCNDNREPFAATWSPDGQWIVFYTGETLPNGLPI